MQKSIKEKRTSGITLIALIITVIVILILAGVVIISLRGTDSAMVKATKARFLNDIGVYQDELSLYVSTSPLTNYDANNIYELSTVNVGLEGQPAVETVIKSIKQEHKNKIIVQGNKLYYYYTRQYGDMQEVEWCFESGIGVWGYSDYEQFKEDTMFEPVPLGEYAEKDGAFVCAPDLTGFSRESTYYVTYSNLSSDSNPTLTSIKRGEPQDWYKYGTASSNDKKWANIATVNTTPAGEELTAYFVWIPRYVYKLNTSTQDVDIRFVSKDNIYKYKDENGQVQQIQYYLKDLETGIMQVKDNTNNLVDTEYKLPEAFWWDNDNDGVLDDGESIPGYWISKYEISEGTIYGERRITDCIFTATSNSITLSKIKTKKLADGSSLTSFDIYVDGELDGNATCTANASDGTNGATLNYAIQKTLQANTSYTIKVVAKSSTGKTFDVYEEKVKTNYENISEITKPNFTGFNGFGGTQDANGYYTLSNTYYITYTNANDDTTAVESTDPVKVDANGYPVNMPSGWYNYENKNWANIVTKNTVNNVVKKAYLVWIPRYEYKLNPAIEGYTVTNSDIFQEVEVRFIPSSQTEASNGYNLPEAFWWDNDNDGVLDNGESLPGYWVTKYEISE